MRWSCLQIVRTFRPSVTFCRQCYARFVFRGRKSPRWCLLAELPPVSYRMMAKPERPNRPRVGSLRAAKRDHMFVR
jgi:hypothetical protein